jgi:hypothetical protein
MVRGTDERQIRPGSRVRFLWGLDDAVGIVRDVHGPPGHLFALVAVVLPPGIEGEEEEHTVSLPLDALEPIEEPQAPR